MGASSKRSAKQSARASTPAAAQSHACATPPKKTGPRAAPFALRTVFEQLEPRLLLSADLNPLATEALLATPTPASGSEFRALTDPGHPSAVTAAAVAPVQRTHELVFIDPRVPDRDQLLAGLTGQSTDGRRFDVIVLDTTRDGIGQVTAAVAERIQIDAVHFLSHGTDGAVQLGATWLDAKTLGANADAVAGWGASLKEDADILFYGCDLAATARGRALVQWIADLTKADVAASTDATGGARAGGDWELEAQSGSIEARVAMAEAARASWSHTLAAMATGPESRANIPTSFPQDQAAVATAPDGRFVLAWVSDGQDGGGKGVYARLYDANGAAQTAEVPVNTTTSNDQVKPAVAIDGAGNFTVVWSGEGTGDSPGVFARRFGATGTPFGAEFRVNSAVSGTQASPDIAMETNGGFAVVWQSNETGSIEVWLQRYQANGTAIGGPSLVSVSGGADDYDPSIAMDDDGDFVVAWESDDGSNEGIRARRYSNAGIALDASPIAVNATASGHQERPDVAMDAVGNFVVVWDGESPSDSKGVYGRRFSAAGAALGGDFRANTQTSPEQMEAAVAMSGDGRFVVTWDSKNQDGSGAGVYRQEYTASGALEGTELRVNTTTNGDQTSSAVAMDDNGGYVAAWNGQGPGDADGVFWRRFAVPATGTISGGVYDDTNGDGNIAGDGTFANATVHLFRDLGGGTIDALDLLQASLISPTGNYVFTGLGAGTYYVVVDSRSLGAANVWAEQTYGVAGAALGAGFTTTDAALFGGRERLGAGTSDGATFLNPATAEHVIKVTLAAGAGESGIDFGFSLNAITTARDGDDDLLSPDRSVQGSLRQFIQNANVTAGLQTADFSIGGGGFQSIAIAGGMPALVINDAVVLDAWTQAAPGYTGPPLIELNGAGSGQDGFLIASTASGSMVRGFVINRFGGDGLHVEANDTIIVGNYIGTDASGTAAAGNAFWGVHLLSDFNRLGGTGTGEGNVIAGNLADGVFVDGSTGNLILGNYIGLDAAGTTAIGNDGSGIWMSGASGNTIGGTVLGARNVISGNVVDGITGIGSSGNLIQGNYVGTDVTGSLAIGNGEDGIYLQDGSNNTVGGTSTAARNVISGNTWSGLTFYGTGSNNVAQGNYIGTDHTGTVDLGNLEQGVLVWTPGATTIGGIAAGAGNRIAYNRWDGVEISAGTGHAVLGNVIYQNGDLGIDLGAVLGGDGPTPNDPGDVDTGTNNLQNFPVLTGAATNGTTVTIAGSLNSTASTAYRIEFFANGIGGARFLGAASPDLFINAAGSATFSASLTAPVAVGEIITATATNLTTSSTSEFSSGVAAAAGVAISGTLFHDVNGNANLTDDGAGAVFANVTSAVALYLDDGDLVIDSGDSFVAAVDTNSTGQYIFSGLASGTYYVVVNSRSLGAGAYNGGFTQTDVWADQTYAVAGAANNTAGTTFTTSPDALYGGRNTGASDNALASINTAEHLTKVTLAGSNINDINSGFSFNAIVNPRGDNTDDDTSNARLQQGTLRQFILNSNAIAGTQTANFEIGTPGSTQTINVTSSALPALTDAVILDAWTQGTAGYTGPPIIQLNGAGAGGSATGLTIAGGGSTVRGFVINRFGLDGISVSGGTGNTIAGNYIGTNAGGTADLGNGRYGIELTSGLNLVGGVGSAERNVISGNNVDGIRVGPSSGNIIRGNYIGTNATGTLAIANAEDGIWVDGASNATIGGGTAGAGNVISGNLWSGIGFSSGGTGNIVQGNLIGRNAANSGALGNLRHGIDIAGSNGARIGGLGAGEGNVIANNAWDGVSISSGTGHTVSGNSIHSNAGLGIDVVGGAEDVFGVTDNDIGDADGGTNGLQNLPVLTLATTTGAQITISGTLNSTPGSMFRVEFFASPSPGDSSGHGEGERYLGSTIVSTDGTGNGSLTSPAFTAAVPIGERISATATNLTSGDTSEFSAHIAAAAPNTAPTANDVSASGNEDDAQIAITLVASDAEGPVASFRLATLPANGVLYVDAALTIAASVGPTYPAVGNVLTLYFVPVTNWNGSTAFQFTATDAGGLDDATPATATIDVTAQNDAPSNTVPASISVTEDVASPISGISIADPDVGAGALVVSLSVPSGTLAATSAGGVAVGGSGSGTLTLAGTLTDLNAFLALPSVSFTTAPGATAPVILTVATNDQGNTGAGGAQTDNDTITLTIVPVNDAPQGADATVSMPEDTVYVFGLGDFGFSDPGDTPANGLAAVRIASLPLAGTLTLNAVAVTPGDLVSVADIGAGLLVFAPAASANGMPYASFTFQVRDDGGVAGGGVDLDPTPNTLTINVSAVNDPPTAVNDTATVAEDSGATTINVLANDSFAPDAGETLTITGVTQGASGSVAIVGGTTVTYTPSADFFGPDSFTYTISDGNGGTATASVSVTVTPANDPPQAVNDLASVAEDSGASTINVLANDSIAPDAGETLTITGVTQGASGTVAIVGGTTVTYTPNPGYAGPDSFTYTISDGNGGTATATVAVTVSAVNDPPTANDDVASVAEDSGASTIDVLLNDSIAPDVGETLTITGVTQGANGTVAIVAGTTVSYTPNADFFGADSFTYTVSDGNGGTATASVSVTVTPANDPPQAVNDLASVAEDSGASTINVLANDSIAPDAGETLTITGVTQGANGTVAILGGGATVSYTPNADFFGPDSFTYTVDDGNGGTATATVNVTVTPANDPPVANDDVATVAEDSGANTLDVLPNDSIVPDSAETLTITGVTQGASGSVAIVGGTTVTYTSNAGYSGPDSFTYTIDDGNGGTATATVTVTVTNVNNSAPLNIVPGAQISAEDTPLVFSTGTGNRIAVSDPDADPNPLEVTLTAVQGTLTLAGTTGLTFTVGDGTADVTMTFTGTMADINAALDGMSFLPPLDYDGPASVTIATGDLGSTGAGGPQSDTDTVNIAVVVVDDSPTLDLDFNNSSGALGADYVGTFTEGVGSVPIADIDARLLDNDSANLASLTVTITNLLDGVDEVLTADTTGTLITANFVPGSGVLTLNGADTVANYQQVLRTIHYENLSDAPSPAQRIITFVASDGGSASNVGTARVTIAAVNDAPTATIAAPGYAAIENVPLALHATGLGVADIDALPASVVTVYLSSISGLLSATASNGTGIAGVGSPTLTLTGTLAQINAVLDGTAGTVTYLVGSDSPAPTDTLDLAIDDMGATGLGGAQWGWDSVTVNLTAVNDAPLITTPGAVSTPEDAPLVFSAGGGNQISITDVDAAGSPVELTINAANGVVTLAGTAGLVFFAGDGTADASMTFRGTVAAINAALDGLVFAPPANYNGSGFLSLVVNDLGNSGLGGPLSDGPDLVTITVTPVNDLPSGADNVVSMPQDTARAFSAADFGFSDIDAGDAMSAVRIDTLSLPPGVTLQLGGSNVTPGQVIAAAQLGTLVFTPAPGMAGPGYASFTFSVQDTSGPAFDASPNTFTLNVTPVGTPGITVTPTAGLVTTEAGGNATFSVVLDTQPLADVVITLSSSDATEGTVAPVSLTFTSADWNVAQTVTVTGVADALADGSVAYAIVLDPAASADLGYAGLDPADVSVTNLEANAPPTVTVPPGYAVTEGSFLALAGTGLSVLDTDAGAVNVTVTLSVSAGMLVVSGPPTVTVAGSGTPVVTLTGPVADIDALLAGGGMVNYFVGSDAPPAFDTLTLAINDNHPFDPRTASASVAIGINPVNDAPVNTLPGGSTTLEDTPFVFSAAGGNQISVTDVDAGGAPLQVTLNGTNGVITLSGTGGLAFSSGDGTADASLTFTGTLPAINAALNGLVFTPNLNYNGLAFIQLTTNDLGASGAGGALSDADLATIDVLAVNDAPDGTDTTVALNEDSTYTFNAANFGFTDVDFGDAMTEVRIDSVSLPAGATLMLGATPVTPSTVIPVANIGNLVFTPVPNANGAGYASFTFSVRDTGVPPGPLFDLAPNTMTMNVTPVNDLPIITSDGGGATAAIVVAENTSAVTTATATDVDLQPLTFSLAGVDAGRFSIDSVTGVLTFNTAPNFEAPADAGADNVYNVTVRVSDGAGGIDTQGLTITVTNANDAPTAGNDAYVTDEDLPLAVAAAGVLGNDGDEDGTPVTAVLVTGPANGAVAFNADGSFVYTPNANFAGVDTFTYQASDGALGSALATVTITVNPINDAPTAADGNVVIAAAYAFSVADFNYFDVDGDPLGRIRIIALPVEGQLLFNGLAATLNQEVTAAELAAGLLTYVPPTTSSATAPSFGFSVSDGTLYEAASHTMTIGFASGAVTPPAPPPAPPTITPPPAPPADPPAEPPAAGEPTEPGGGGATSGGGRGGGSGGGEGAAPPAPPAPEGAAAPAESAQAAAAGVVASAAPQAGSAPAGSIGFQSGGVAANPNIAAPALPADQRGEPPAGEVKAEMEVVAAMAAPEVRQALDEMRERAQEDTKLEARVSGSVFVVSTGLSVGYVLWLLRGGALIASLLSSLPAWRLVDPLPVLGSMGGRAGDEDDDSLEDLVANNDPPSVPGEDALVDNDNVGSVRT